MDSHYLLIKKSKTHNYGAFAKEPIKKGTKIIEYIGEKITKKEARRREILQLKKSKKKKATGADYVFYLNKKYDIDGNVPYNLAKYINHSCDPNSKFEIANGHIWIIAIKDIKKSEEITYNYGYALDEKIKEYKCQCGAKNCVGYILDKKFWPKLKFIKKAYLPPK